MGGNLLAPASDFRFTAEVVSEIFHTIWKRGSRPDAGTCKKVAMWLNNTCRLPRSKSELDEAKRPSDRALKAARELLRAVEDRMEPGTDFPDGRYVFCWADGQVINPGNERLRPLHNALRDAMPPLREKTPSGDVKRSGDFSILACQLHDCFVWGAGGGRFSKDGPAVRFVQATLKHAGYGHFDLGTIEQALRRTAPLRAEALRRWREV